MDREVLQSIGVTDEDIIEVGQEGVEHLLWFSVEDSLNNVTISEEPAEEIDNYNPTYSELIDTMQEPLSLLLRAHFLEFLNKKISDQHLVRVQEIIDIYEKNIQDDHPVSDEFIARILEAYYTFKEFQEDKLLYNHNPLLFLLDSEELPENFSSDAMHSIIDFPDHVIIFFYASFCIYNHEYSAANILDVENILPQHVTLTVEKIKKLL